MLKLVNKLKKTCRNKKNYCKFAHKFFDILKPKNEKIYFKNIYQGRTHNEFILFIRRVRNQSRIKWCTSATINNSVGNNHGNTFKFYLFIIFKT